MKTNKHISNAFHTVICLLAGLGAAVGCTTDPDEEIVNDGGSFVIASGDLNFNIEKGEEIIFIPVSTNIPESQWKIGTPSAAWCKFSKSYDNETGLMIAVEESEEEKIRTATMKVSAGADEYTITVNQLGYGPAILVNDVSVEAAGGPVHLEVVANIGYTIGAPLVNDEDEADWIRRTGVSTRAFAEEAFEFSAEPNTWPFRRSAKIAVTAADPMYFAASTTCTITQLTKAIEIENLPEAEVKAQSATASESHAGNGADQLIDDNYETVFHSRWQAGYEGDETTTTEFPVEWKFTFAGDNTIDYFRLYSGTGNGRIGRFDIYYKTQGASGEQKLGDTEGYFDFKKTGGVQVCRFGQSLTNVTELRMVIYNGAGDNGSGRKDKYNPQEPEGFVSAQEIEFYTDQSGDANDKMLQVFTDLSCSELRAGVTRDDILELYRMVPFLAQVIGVPMMEGTYSNDFERQFRIAEYKPYSDIDLNTQLLTKKYTQMDNPTGIEVKAGDKIVVCVDKIPAGQEVSLAVYGDNGDSPNYGGMSGGENSDSANQLAQLTAGYNAIDITASGMCYILNTAAQLSDASESIRVHIPATCGTVQGYYDIERHTDEDYVDMLSKVTYKYFVAKGRKMIFNFHVASLKSLAPTSIKSGLAAWDNIVSWQHELMGLDKLGWFNNHIMAVSTSGDAYMDASNRRVNFQTETALPKIISEERLLAEEDNTWGPAHELGHVNQGAINWISCSESSNNLFSNYAIYKMGKYGSRGQTIEYLAGCYARKEPWALMGSSTHQNEDTEVHMRMNWQLWNYYHRCEFNTDFWPTLFELLREDPLPSEFSARQDPGASQLKFAEKACDAAKQDLTEFFEVWGFYREIDQAYSQYGTAQYTVTKEMIEQSKARIAAKGYPKAAPIQYIEDRQKKDNTIYSEFGYYDVFKNKKTITGTPTYEQSNRKIIVKGCEGAVAVELRKGSAEGELLYFSNLGSFDVPAQVDMSGVKLYAVQQDGVRKEIRKQ